MSCSDPRLRYRGPLLSIFILFLSASSNSAQGVRADYERVQSFKRQITGKVRNEQVRLHWFANGRRAWYRRELPDNRHEFVLVDVDAGTRTTAFDHEQLTAALSKVVERELTGDRLPFDRLDWSDDAQSVTVAVSGRRYRVDLTTYAATPVEERGSGNDPSIWLKTVHRTAGGGDDITLRWVNRTQQTLELLWFPPDGPPRSYGALAPNGQREQHTFVGHVWLLQNREGKTLAALESRADLGEIVIDDDVLSRPPRSVGEARRRRTQDEGRSPDGRWQAFLRDDNLWLRTGSDGEERRLTETGTTEDRFTNELSWSPDARQLVARQVHVAPVRQIPIVEAAPKDQLQPRLKMIDYNKPGDPLDQPRLRLIDVESGQIRPIAEDFCQNVWSVSVPRWWDDGSGFWFVVNERGHQRLRVITVDATTGESRTVIDEQSPTFIDYSGKFYCEPIAGTKQLLWMSERDGWCHLYRYNATTCELLNPVTHGEWVVRGIERVDAERQQVWFRAGGIVPGQDPYFVHLARVGFDGSGLTALTDGDGTHRWEFSPDGAHFVDTWSRVDSPPISELRSSTDGSLVCRLEQADAADLLKTGWAMPEPFVAKGRDGTTDIYGVIYRPSNFEPGQKYPVIEKIYAGPHAAFVPKAFGLQPQEHEFAELGFIVVQIDGMGTSHRSKAFHDVCWKNLKDAGFPDRIAWLKSAAAKYPELDLTRVGIFGGSAGGQNALAALLHHGEFYRVAVADCGCHDNRMDKVWWNEQWLGYPIGEHYADNSNVTHAHRLTGKLMMIVGEVDTNVDPASTMQVAKALIDADKDFELLILPGVGHGAAETPYGSRRRAEFLVRHLLHAE